MNEGCTPVNPHSNTHAHTHSFFILRFKQKMYAFVVVITFLLVKIQKKIKYIKKIIPTSSTSQPLGIDLTGEDAPFNFLGGQCSAGQ